MLILKTAQKMAIARLASSCVLFTRRILCLSKLAIVKRGGIWWSIDLSEGIDFSIYLLGGFEPNTLKLYSNILKPGDTVLDIGANIGSHTLPLARIVGETGRVIAFEPTRYAIEKLFANIGLNKGFSDRISVNQIMLVSNEGETLEPEIYSSWPLFEPSKNVHHEHLGKLMNTDGAVAMTLDQAVKQLQIEKIDFIKIDVDGHEYSVLNGGKETLLSHRPPILMEFAPYLFDPEFRQFEKIVELFSKLEYSLLDADTGKSLPLDADHLRAIIPVGGSKNVFLKHLMEK
jgi:FkbM family methyltransferase